MGTDPLDDLAKAAEQHKRGSRRSTPPPLPPLSYQAPPPRRSAAYEWGHDTELGRSVARLKILGIIFGCIFGAIIAACAGFCMLGRFAAH